MAYEVPAELTYDGRLAIRVHACSDGRGTWGTLSGTAPDALALGRRDALVPHARELVGRFWRSPRTIYFLQLEGLLFGVGLVFAGLYLQRRRQPEYGYFALALIVLAARAVLHDGRLDELEVAVEPVEVVFGAVLLAAGRKAPHVGEEHGHLLAHGVAPLDLDHVVATEQAQEIMALFPTADGAIEAALAMLERVEAKGGALGDDLPLRIGIGLHTGPLMLGTIGGHERLDTGVVGDAVNTAARLESLTKTYDVPLLLSHATKEAAGDHFRFEELDTIAPKGKAQEITLFTVERAAGQVERVTGLSAKA